MLLADEREGFHIALSSDSHRVSRI